MDKIENLTAHCRTPEGVVDCLHGLGLDYSVIRRECWNLAMDLIDRADNKEENARRSAFFVCASDVAKRFIPNNASPECAATGGA